jgi:Transglycosylase SLT domain.
MPGTAAGLGIDPRNPLQSVAGTASYLGQLQQKYGDDRIALAAYNWGPGNVDKWLQNGADPAKLPAETQKYISTVMGNLRRFGGALPAQGIGTVGITPVPCAARIDRGRQGVSRESGEVCF